MSDGRSEAWITGIGLATSLGVGVDAHWARLARGGVAEPVIDETLLAPYPVHPLCEIDYAEQIPGRSDRRQMGDWQLLGTYAAGLALTDAGIAGDAALCGETNLLVAAGGGERDIESDEAIHAGIGTAGDPDAFLNRMMMDTVRPTLFLAQLSNLTAGNISIVHGVTGSSRTFLGEEMAGVSAVEHAVRRIRAGQGSTFLVGAAFSAAHAPTLLAYILGKRAWEGAYRPVWQRAGGGFILGSVGAFLVLEAGGHAEARGARAYARLDAVTSDGPAGDPIAGLAPYLPAGDLLVLSGASGLEPQTGAERASLAALQENGVKPVVRAFGSVLGHSVEAHFTAGLALAAIAAHHRETYDPFADIDFETRSSANPQRVLVTTWGQWRGAGAAVVSPIERRTGHSS